MIAALVLAAGRSVRMGAAKLTLSVGGTPLLALVLDASRASRCGDVLVVVGGDAERVGAIAARAGVRTVFNPRFAEGMGTSLAAGIAALPDACDAAVVLLGDQPRVTAAVIDALIAVHETTGKPIVASRYAGAVRGAPALIARALFEEARALGGDAAGRVLIRRHPDLVAAVDLDADAAWDVDTPEDLERLRRAGGAGTAE